MISLLILLNYIVCAVVCWICINTLRRRNWCSLLAVMTLSFVVNHMVGLYWVPDLLTQYRTPFDERSYMTMIALHMFCAVVMACGCLLQMRSEREPKFVQHKYERIGIVFFLGALLLLSVPVAILMIIAFLLLEFGPYSRRNAPGQALSPGELLEIFIRTPLFVVLVSGSILLLAYDLFYLGTWENVKTVVQSGGFSSIRDYFIQRKVGLDFIPSFLNSQIETVKICIGPFIVGILLLAFKYKHGWIRLGLFLAMVIGMSFITLGASSFSKSGFPRFLGGVVLTWILIPMNRNSLTKSNAKSFVKVMIIFIVIIASVFLMYYYTGYTDYLTDSIEKIASRLFVVPDQSAYSWFYVFPASKPFLGYSQSHIMSFLFNEPYLVTGYLPFEVSFLSIGHAFGLNANFVASAWARHGVWEAALVPVLLVIGTLLVDRWLRYVPDLYVSWPVYAVVYVQSIVSITTGFDGVVISFGAWLLPIFCCVLLKLSRVYEV